MSELDDLLASVSAPPAAPVDQPPPEGVNPATGRPRITVTPRPEEPPPPGDVPPGAFGSPGKYRALDPRSRELAIRTMLGEAADQGDEGMRAVAHVIINRLDSGRWGDSIPRVIGARGQFEPWMTQAGRNRMYGYGQDSPSYQAASRALDAALTGDDITQGATHFYAPKLNAQLALKDGRKAVPDWAQGTPLVEIGGHQFFAPDRQPQQGGGGARRGNPQMLAAASAGELGQPPEVPTFAAYQPPQAPAQAAVQPGKIATIGAGNDLDRMLAELDTPAPPPGAIIHNADGTSTVAGTGVSAQRPTSVTAGNERESQAAMEALKKRAADTAPQIGEVGRHVANVAQGVTANWSDELTSALAGLIAKARGGSYQDAYAVAQQIQKQELDRLQQEHPGVSLAEQLAGGLALPIGGAAGAGATLWQRMKAAAKLGGAVGAAAGAGAGDGAADRAIKGTVGAGLGLGVGAAAVPAMEGIGAAAKVATGRPVEMLRRAVNPQGAAERMTGAEMAAAQRIDPTAANRLLPSEVTPTGPAAMIDTLGTPGAKLARTVRNVSPEAEQELNNLLQPRFEQQASRISSWIDKKFGFPNTKALEDAIDKTKSATNNVNYKLAGLEASKRYPSGMWDEGFEQMMQAPEVQAAVRRVMIQARSKSAREGFTPRSIPFEDKDGRLVLKQIGQTPQGDPLYLKPNFEFWDAVKKDLDKQGINNFNAREWARVLRSHVTDLVPSYAEARGMAAAFFKGEDALDAGGKFFSAKDGQYGIDDVRQMLAKVSPEERQLFRAGFANAIKDRLTELGFRQDVVKQLMQSPAAVQRAQLALGSKPARELQAVLRAEGLMQRALEAVRGNSTTAAQLIGAATFEGADPTGSHLGNLSAGAIVGALIAKGNNAINRRVAEHVAKLLTSRDPVDLQRVASMAVKNTRLFNALTAAEQRLSTAAGSRSGGAAPAIGVQSMMPVRADDQQPDVDRPGRQ